MKVKSESNPEMFYDIDLALRTCTCPDFKYRRKPNYPCKHIKKWLDNGNR